jgi:hypothetical protein
VRVKPLPQMANLIAPFILGAKAASNPLAPTKIHSGHPERSRRVAPTHKSLNKPMKMGFFAVVAVFSGLSAVSEHSKKGFPTTAGD